MRSSKIRGVTLLEMMVVIALAMVMMSITFISLMPTLKKNHVDQAYDITLSAFRTYRNMAISQGTRYIIYPTAPGTITVQQWHYLPPPAASPAPVTVATINIPTDIQFGVQAGFPNPGPDNFNGAAAIAFNACTVTEGGAPCVIFYPDGSSEDDASTPGNFNSGVIYLTRPGDLYSSRAIDVWGTTGRIRGWRLYNIAGTNTWVQQ